MAETTRLLTADELERMPDDDFRYELVRGRLVRMSPVGTLHGKVTMAIGMLLAAHVKAENMGEVFPEVGFKLTTNPDTVRAPDMAFVRRERIPSPPPRGFFQGPPDVAVEVLSPDDRPPEVSLKVDEYLRFGTRLVLVIDPERTMVVVHRPSTPAATLTGRDAIDLDDVVPGFRCQVRQLFE